MTRDELIAEAFAKWPDARVFAAILSAFTPWTVFTVERFEG